MLRILLRSAVIISIFILTGCSSVSMPDLSANFFSNKETSETNRQLWAGDPQTIWAKLQTLSTNRLNALTPADATQSGWIQLALINKRYSLNTQRLIQELERWRAANPSHPGNALLPSNEVLNQILTTATPKNIALLLPENGPYGSSGQTVREGFLNAYYANLNHEQNVKFYNTAQTTDLKNLYLQAVAEGADFVIGPLTKENVQQLSSMGSFSVTTLALNYTDNNLPANFYEFGLLPEDEITQIAKRAHQANLSRALIIAPQSAWGRRIATAFVTRFQTMGGSITDSLYFTSIANLNQDVPRLLRVDPNAKTPAGRRDFDVVVLFAKPAEARTIVPLLKYYAVKAPIYSNSSVYASDSNPTENLDLNGVTVCDIPWKKTSIQSSNARLYAVGQDAYLISQSLLRLRSLPNFAIYGKTGALILSQEQKIHRSLPCSTIRNGLL